MDIRQERLKKARDEAYRFVDAVDEATQEINNFPGQRKCYAAAKRSSMDLTRSLAVLRSSLYRN